MKNKNSNIDVQYLVITFKLLRCSKFDKLIN